MGTAADDAERSRRIAAAAAVSVQQHLGSRGSMLDTMRSKADTYSFLGIHATARFLADKVITAAPSPPAEDILRLARVHALAGQHRRALHLLTTSNLAETCLSARLVTAQCLFAVGEYDDCLTTLGESEGDLARFNENAENAAVPRFGSAKLHSMTAATKSSARATSNSSSAHADTPEIRAALCLMRAKVFEELENTKLAAWWYKRALVWDAYCYEAYMCLVEAGLLSGDDAGQFAEDLLNFGHSGGAPKAEPPGDDVKSVWLPTGPPDDDAISGGRGLRVRNLPQGSPTLAPSLEARSPTLTPSLEARSWICAFYRAQVDRVGLLPPGSACAELASGKTTGNVPVGIQTAMSQPLEYILSDSRMRENVDVMAMRAARLFGVLNYQECVRLTRSILNRDPFVELRVMILHLAALVELDERHELFVLAHSLVEKSPREACSWLGVGYYYFSCGKYETARRYLQKATSLHPRLGAAWLAIGHAFAAQDESDHAMAAYRTACRLLPQAPLPHLFMGMEYVRQSSLTHASTFFQIAREACPTDPAPRHELGVVAYRTGDLQGAAAFFKAALSLWETGDNVRSVVPSGGRRAEAEEATLFNLGHCYRRLQEFERAKRCYERALGLRPRSASTCCALGMTLHAIGDYSAAVAMYHRALRYSPDDTMSSLLLERALEDLCTIPI